MLKLPLKQLHFKSDVIKDLIIKIQEKKSLSVSPSHLISGVLTLNIFIFEEHLQRHCYLMVTL